MKNLSNEPLADALWRRAMYTTSSTTCALHYVLTELGVPILDNGTLSDSLGHVWACFRGSAQVVHKGVVHVASFQSLKKYIFYNPIQAKTATVL